MTMQSNEVQEAIAAREAAEAAVEAADQRYRVAVDAFRDGGPVQLAERAVHTARLEADRVAADARSEQAAAMKARDVAQKRLVKAREAERHLEHARMAAAGQAAAQAAAQAQARGGEVR